MSRISRALRSVFAALPAPEVVTKQQMMDLLVAIDLPPDASAAYVGLERDGTGLFVRDRRYPLVRTRNPKLPPSLWEPDESATHANWQAAIAHTWTEDCHGAVVISLWADSGECIRYDMPGSMFPGQMAELAFVADRRLMKFARAHATTAFLVDQDSPLPARPLTFDEAVSAEADVAAISERTAYLRREMRAWIKRMGGPEWCAVLDDGTLQMIDPNSGQGSDPNNKSRFQYRVLAGVPQMRMLPPASVGDEWLDDPEAPEWDDTLLAPPGFASDSPVQDYYRLCLSQPS